MSQHVLISYARDTVAAVNASEHLRNVLICTVTDDLFDRPLGPHADCFSTSQVVRMFEAGAMPDELAHILDCPICHDLVSRSAKLSQALDVSVDAKQPDGFGRLVRGLISRHRSSPQPTIAAVLGLLDPLIAVGPHGNVTVTCELMPCVGSSVDRIDPSSLRLDGAILADSGTLISNAAESIVPRVCFTAATLSRHIRRTLTHNARVVGQIRVSGGFLGEQAGAFVGHAKLELVKPLQIGRRNSNTETKVL